MIRIFLSCLKAAFFVADWGQNACFERQELIKHLNGKFKEAPVAAGVAANGLVVEILTNADGKTWTMILNKADGSACVMASGEAWMTFPPKPVGDET